MRREGVEESGLASGVALPMPALTRVLPRLPLPSRRRRRRPIPELLSCCVAVRLPSIASVCSCACVCVPEFAF